MTDGFDERMAAFKARFQSRASSSAPALRAALANHDLAELARLAHILAGSAGLFGYPDISTASQEAELAAETGDQAALARLVHELAGLLDEAAQGR